MGEALDVVDVVLALGHQDEGRVAERGAEMREVRRVARRQRRLLARGRATRAASASPSSAASAGGSSPFADGASCIRLTTSPPNGIPAWRSLRWKKIASSIGS